MLITPQKGPCNCIQVLFVKKRYLNTIGNRAHFQYKNQLDFKFAFIFKKIYLYYNNHSGSNPENLSSSYDNGA